MKYKYVIIDLVTMNFMKSQDGIIILYDTEADAIDNCGLYELDNAWVMKLVYQHKEQEYSGIVIVNRD